MQDGLHHTHPGGIQLVVLKACEIVELQIVDCFETWVFAIQVRPAEDVVWHPRHTCRQISIGCCCTRLRRSCTRRRRVLSAEAVRRPGLSGLRENLFLRFANAHGGHRVGATVTEVTIVELRESLNAFARETVLCQEIRRILLTRHSV